MRVPSRSRVPEHTRFLPRPVQLPCACLAFALLMLLGVRPSQAQTITTVAGNGVATFSGDGGQAILASFNTPRGIAIDAQGNIYIADKLNHRIRRVSPDGTVNTVAGTGTPGFSGDGGAAVNAQLNQPEDVWVDAGGTLYIADSSNHRIRKVVGGVINTVAGSGGPGFTGGFNGDGILATNAQLNRPTSVLVDAGGNIFIADSSNQRIRRVSTGGTISTVAGNGVQAYSGEGVAATSASLRFPLGITMDGAGNLYIADAGNDVVRRVTPAGIINTVAGNGIGAGTDSGSFSGDGGAALSAGLNTPEDVAIDSNGNLFIADTENYRIRRVSGGVINTVAGTGTDGFSGDGGAATSALLNLPWSATLDSSGNLLVGDMLNQRVRRIAGAGSPVSSVGTGPGPAAGQGNPSISAGGVLDGAGFRGAISAGAIVSVFGQDLATDVQTAATIPLPPSLLGTSVSINGITAPLFYVSSTQLNVQLPFNVSAGNANIQVTRNGAVGAQAVTISPFSPAIFTVPSGGTGPGAILHNTTGVLVTPQTPAARGEFISIYCTGLGAVSPAVAAGDPGPSGTLSRTTTTPTVMIGSINVIPDFSGLAPTFAGLYQLNVQVPQGVASGSAIPVSISIGGAVSNQVTIAVQ